MLQNSHIQIKLPWGALVLIAAAIASFGFTTLAWVLDIFSTAYILILLTTIVGTVVSIGGLVLTTRARYEVFPTKLQVIGAVLNGLLLAVMFVTLLLATQFSIVSALFLVAGLIVIEFILQRVFQSRKLSLRRAAALFLVAITGYLFFTYFLELKVIFGVFFGALFAKELIGRYTQTHLLSSWVNSIWNGLALILSGPIVVALLVANAQAVSVQELATGVASLPIWVGLLALCVGLAILILQFLKRKISIASGYGQHKLQLWTAFLFVAAILLGLSSLELVVAFLVLIAAISVSEGSMFPKE